MADAQRQAEETHRAVARSTSRLERSAEKQVDNAARTTQLAADRTVLAAERTYAAWVRTGLASLAAGVGSKALLHDVVVHPLPTVAGVMLVLFSGFCFVAAVWRELRPTLTAPAPDVRRLPRAVLVTVNGVLLLVSLCAAYGLLAAR